MRGRRRRLFEHEQPLRGDKHGWCYDIDARAHTRIRSAGPCCTPHYLAGDARVPPMARRPEQREPCTRQR